jgi:hypothetical protein
VHPFLLSHEEKRPWLGLSVGGIRGRGWSSMASHGGAHQRGERGGTGGEEGGLGLHGEGLLWRSSVNAPLSVLLVCSVPERKPEGGRRK